MATAATPETAERFEWVDVQGGRTSDLFRGSYRGIAGEPCSGVRVVRGRGDPGEAPEGHLARHAIVVNVGSPAVHEFRWAGGRWEKHAFAPLAVHVLPAGVPHAVRWGEPVESVVVEISDQFVARVDGTGRRTDLRPAIAVPDRVVAHAALALAEEVEAGSPGGMACAESLAGALVQHLLGANGHARRLHQPEKLTRAQLARVLGHVGDHLESSLSLRELAALLQMDVFRFVRAFRQTIGVPPHQYLLRARIDRAKGLLGSTRLSVSEVALATGFATPSHFATTFRKVTGTTPRGYRASLR